MTARIKIGSVVGSRALPSTQLSVAQTFSNNDDTGVLGWKWEWLDTPSISPTLDPPPAPSFGSTLVVTPDVAGWSLKIRLTTFRDAARTIIDAVDEAVLGIRFAPPPNDFLIPCAGETNQLDVIKGWAREANRILAFALAGGGGSGARDPLYWAASSNNDGTANGSPDVLNSGAFTTDPNRINKWDGTAGSNSTQLPAFGVGDHNRRVAYVEGSVGGDLASSTGLVISPQGATQIVAGGVAYAVSYTVWGPGALHVFRYDETIDKFVLEHGAGALAPREVRSIADHVKLSIDLNGTSLTGGGPYNDISFAGVGRVRILELTVDASFDRVGGISAIESPNTDFAPRKTIFNNGTLGMLLDPSAGGSYPFFRQFTTDPFALLPGEYCEVQFLPTVNLWQIVSNEPLHPKRVVQVADCTGQYSELLRASGNAGNVVVTMPAAPVEGQRFGVARVDSNIANTVTINGNGGDQVQQPTTPWTTSGGFNMAVRNAAIWFWDGLWLLERAS